MARHRDSSRQTDKRTNPPQYSPALRFLKGIIIDVLKGVIISAALAGVNDLWRLF